MMQIYLKSDRIETSSPSPFAAPFGERPLRSLRSRHIIPLNSGQIWVVRSGIVQLSTLHLNGDETLLGLAGPDTAFSLDWACVYPYQAEALTDVIVSSYTMKDIQQSSLLAQEMVDHLSRRLKQTEALLAMTGCRRIEDRLRQLLLLLKAEVGHPISGGTRLSVKLTHQHLASAIGTTRVTVTRLMGQFKQEGWIELDKQRHIVIPASSRLSA
jgi:CRP-like cAMP-binding protein